MPIVSFPMRNARRDAEADRNRFRKLEEYLDAMRTEIAREADG